MAVCFSEMILKCLILLPLQEHSLENLPWSFQKTTYLGRINEDVIKSMVNTCRRQPYVLICGSVTFSEEMERSLKAIGLKEDSYFIF